MIIKFADESEFLWTTTRETCVPTMYGLGAALPVVVASRKAIMAFNWDFFCVCGGANALTTKPVVFECMLASFV